MFLQMALPNFYDWVLFRYIHVCICIYIYTQTHSYMHITSLSIHLVSGRLGYFHVLAIVNSAAVNIGVHVSFWIRVFIFFGYISWSGVAGSYGNTIFHFFFEKPSYYFLQWLHHFTLLSICTRVLISLYSCQHLLFSVLFFFPEFPS